MLRGHMIAVVVLRTPRYLLLELLDDIFCVWSVGYQCSCQAAFAWVHGEVAPCQTTCRGSKCRSFPARAPRVLVLSSHMAILDSWRCLDSTRRSLATLQASLSATQSMIDDGWNPRIRDKPPRSFGFACVPVLHALRLSMHEAVCAAWVSRSEGEPLSKICRLLLPIQRVTLVCGAMCQAVCRMPPVLVIAALADLVL